MKEPAAKAADAPMRILIADDHPLFRGALRQSLSGIISAPDIREAGSLDEVRRCLEAQPDMDLVLLDLSMPGMRGFSGLTYLRAQFPQVPVVVVSANEDPAVIRSCIEFGAAGFIPKTSDAETISAAIRAVSDGGTWVPPDVDITQSAGNEAASLAKRLHSLTPQQMRVLLMLSEGLLNKQIAYELDISEATVKAHVSAILSKLGVENRTQAVIAASRIDLGQRPQPE